MTVQLLECLFKLCILLEYLNEALNKKLFQLSEHTQGPVSLNR